MWSKYSMSHKGGVGVVICLGSGFWLTISTPTTLVIGLWTDNPRLEYIRSGGVSEFVRSQVLLALLALFHEVYGDLAVRIDRHVRHHLH